MLIHRIAAQLATSAEFRTIERALTSKADASMGVAQSARPIVIAALHARDPRPTLVVVAGEDAAERTAQNLAAYVGLDQVERIPVRADMPWSPKSPDPTVIGARCRAMARLAKGDPCLVVASARALARCVPPVNSRFWEPVRYQVGQTVEFSSVAARLLFLGYANAGAVDAPGTFHVHGDCVDVWPTQATSPVRMEFFGDDIDSVRRMVASTGQTIGTLGSVTIYPCRELALTPRAIERAQRSLYARAQDDQKVATHCELLGQGIVFPEAECYLPDLYAEPVSPLVHLCPEALVILAEPRSLMDDADRGFDEARASALDARFSSGGHGGSGAQGAPGCLDGLWLKGNALDFGTQQRLTLVSLVRAGNAGVTVDLRVQQPDVAGSSRLQAKLNSLRHCGFTTVFAIPDIAARRSMKLSLTDASIPIVESLVGDADNALPIAPGNADVPLQKLARGPINLVDAPIPAGAVFPDAHLAIISVNDLVSRMARHGKRRRANIDVTDITFPFKPGDYVVHAHHGIALFECIVRREVAGKERDYFQLDYADGDKLFVPFEQVDRLTRYVGPDGEKPRLTRLNTADWSRATTKARASAKKLAFDLVDLYTRRAAVQGFRFAPDSAWQRQMEDAFPYELTDDQKLAIFDIKTDMESARPMDRLLCGDVGFGKTEVALRAAFKATQDGKQVMVLCPTTILAQQHFQTLSERFAPFNVSVDVLSRFRTAKQQKDALARFAAGELDVLVGTHRLLSNDVNPHDLGLVIVDEEQRFGVNHKEHLKNLREQVDVLTLSATPIPRTMQMAVSGVRDMSLIKTAPSGRKPVKVHVGEWDEDVVSAAIRLELARGGQVYYVSNRVKTIDHAVNRVLSVAPEARVGVSHGKMSEKELEDVMQRFITGECDVLVATTIIESGIDNPHTNTLIIEDSQRLGLAQLYQLKGRVGRGREQAYAYFMFPPDVPLSTEATDRLIAIAEYTDLGSGMKIALRDLEIRGAGSMMGAEQSGNLSQVGFDLYSQMLGEAVAMARGEEPDDPDATVTLNLPANYFLAEDYMPAVDRRVLVYRKLACAGELAGVDELQAKVEAEAGPLPPAAVNLFDRTRVRIRADRLGVDSITYANGRLTFDGLKVPTTSYPAFREAGAQVFAKTGKVNWPFKGDMDAMLPEVLKVLALVGGGDDDGEVSDDEALVASALLPEGYEGDAIGAASAEAAIERAADARAARKSGKSAIATSTAARERHEAKAAQARRAAGTIGAGSAGKGSASKGSAGKGSVSSSGYKGSGYGTYSSGTSSTIKSGRPRGRNR